MRFDRVGSAPADVDIVQGQPCVVMEEGTPRTLHLRCGARLATDHVLDVTSGTEVPVSFFTGSDHLDIVGWTDPGSSAPPRPLLARTTLDGSPLAGFGDNGVARLDSLKVDGLPVVELGNAASASDGSTYITGVAQNLAGEATDAAVVVAHVSSGGDLDPSFGTDGVLVIRAPGLRVTYMTTMRRLDDGTILILGSAGAGPKTPMHPFAALVNSSGTLVPSFGTGGISTPSIGAGASWFMSMPDPERTHGFPVPASMTLNKNGSVYPLVAEVQADGTLRTDWGGPSRQKLATLTGQGPLMGQGMDIDVAPNGAIIGAAELEHAGDMDTFVGRFGAANGALDSTYGTGGLEAIDTAVGTLDNEWTMAMTLDAQGRAWVVGGSVVRGKQHLHLFRTLGRATSARADALSINPLDAKRNPMRCGLSAKSPCIVHRGAIFRVGSSATGWPAAHPRELQPVFHIWTKPAKGNWVASERLGSYFRIGAHMVSVASLRLPVGAHEISVTRNGAAAWGPNWVGTVYVRVR